jgi:hypothetical protein
VNVGGVCGACLRGLLVASMPAGSRRPAPSMLGANTTEPAVLSRMLGSPMLHPFLTKKLFEVCGAPTAVSCAMPDNLGTALRQTRGACASDAVSDEITTCKVPHVLKAAGELQRHLMAHASLRMRHCTRCCCSLCFRTCSEQLRKENE